MTAAIVVGRVHAHARARDAVLAETDTGGNTALFEGSIFLVEVELVGLRVVGDHDVRPAVAVVVENRDAQTLRSGIAQPAFWVASSNLPPPRLCHSRTDVPLYDSGVQYDLCAPSSVQ